jgi:predicted N-acetyltransferase YhbS
MMPERSGGLELQGCAMVILYKLEAYPELRPEEFIDLLERSTLAQRRPVEEAETVRGMLVHADVIVTARAGGLLVGVSRAITDFHYCTYLSDLAVDEKWQRQGIGRELIKRTHEAAGIHTTLILLAAPKAQTYYPHVGLTAHESCWMIPRVPRARSS